VYIYYNYILIIGKEFLIYKYKIIYKNRYKNYCRKIIL